MTYAGFVAAGVLALATSPAAQISTVNGVTSTNSLLTPLPGACTFQAIETRLLEWDLNQMGDLVPGALVVDDQSNSRHSKVWFVTRNGDTRVYRFTPGRNFKKDAAEAKSWPLGVLQTGGVRLRHSNDGRFVFVNTNQVPAVENPPVGSAGLVAVDTSDNTRITWTDRPASGQISDVSVDTRGGANNVFTAAPRYFQDPVADPAAFDGVDGVVQRLRPLQPKLVGGKWVVPAEVTRWLVGGGAGTCVDEFGAASPCLPGIVVDRRRGHPIYVTQPDFVNKDFSVGAIAEIDPKPVTCLDDPYGTCAKVRHWPLPPAVASPRQILLDDTGRIWGITSTGTLFSLDVDKSYDKGTVTIHDPLGLSENLFAVAPDGGSIGFTDSSEAESKVTVLFPQRNAKPVYPKVTIVKSVTRRIDGIREQAYPKAHSIEPRVATAMGDKYTNVGDGTYVETRVSTGVATTGSTAPSFSPTGMAPDGARKTGSFFYGVAFSIDPESTSGDSERTNRVGHLEVPVDPEKETDYRKDDDDYDDDGDGDDYDKDDDNDGYGDDVDDDDDNDCTPDAMDKDHDNDGLYNDEDSKSHRENKRTDRGSMAPGEAKSYDMEWNANSVAMLAVVEAADLTTPLSIEFVDPNGVVVLSSPPVLGKAVVTATPALPGLYTVRVKNRGLKSTTYKTTLIGKQIWF
jgi:hypothetical protein